MRIGVLVKQVPATENVKIDEKTGTMIREGVDSELNPLDLHAVEEAVRLKERLGGDAEITVISMGPPQAQKAVKAAIAMGCDGGLLLSDRRFAGSDTLATARTLASGVKQAGHFDLLLSGERATDGETGQVGPAVGEILNLPVLTFVSAVESFSDGYLTVQRGVEGGHERVQAPLPAMISVVKEINVPRLCTLGGKLRAKKTVIPVLGADDLPLPQEHLGLAGSPTKVVKVSYPQITRSGKKISAVDNPDGAVEAILSLLGARGAV